MRSEIKVVFLPQNISVEVPTGIKLLAAANKAKAPIRFSCGVLRCGTCAVKVRGPLAPMEPREREMLERLGLSAGGEYRMSCQAKTFSGDVEVNLSSQDDYDPEVLEEHLS